MSRSLRLVFFYLLLIFTLANIGPSQTSVSKLSPTPKGRVVDEYHGIKVVDDYRWLEDWDNPEVKLWSAAENKHARDYLDHLPSRPPIRERLERLMNESSTRYFELTYRVSTLFAMKAQPPKQHPMLVRFGSAEDQAGEKIIVDPNALSDKGSIAIDFYVPSVNGKLVAVSLSENGSEDGTAHVFDVATGKELSDRVPRVNFGTAGGSIAWSPGGTGFYYTRYPQGGERPPEDANFYQQVYFHKLGTNVRTHTLSARISRELQKSTWRRATMASGCSPQWPTGMVANSHTT